MSPRQAGSGLDGGLVSGLVSGLILAGGRARRMGGRDKGLEMWRGQPLVSHVLQALEPQVQKLYISANRNRQHYAELGHCEVLADSVQGFQGPLAGIAAGLEVVAAGSMVVVPCDAPYLPPDLVARLEAAMDDTDIAVAHDGDRLQSLHLMLRTSTCSSLQNFLRDGGRKPDAWYEQHGYAVADFADCPGAFSNFNSLDDLEQAT